MAELREWEKVPILSANLLPSASILSDGPGLNSIMSIDTPITNVDTVNFQPFVTVPKVLSPLTEHARQMNSNAMDHNLKINEGVQEKPSKFFIENNGRKEAHLKPPLTSNNVSLPHDKCLVFKVCHDQVRVPVISTYNMNNSVPDNSECGPIRCQLSRPDDHNNCRPHINCCQQWISKWCNNCNTHIYNEQNKNYFRRTIQAETIDNTSRPKEAQSQDPPLEKPYCSSSSCVVFFQQILDKFERQEESIKQQGNVIEVLMEMTKRQENIMLKLVGQMAILQSSVSSCHSSNSVAVSPDCNIDIGNQTKDNRNESIKNVVKDRRKSNASEADDAKDVPKKNVSLEKRVCKSPCEIAAKNPCHQCPKNHKHRKDSPRQEAKKNTGKNEHVEDLEKNFHRLTCEDIVRNVGELISSQKDAQQVPLAKRRHSGTKDSSSRTKDSNRNAKKRESMRAQNEYRSCSSSSTTDLDSEELNNDDLFKEVIPNLIPDFNLSNTNMTINTEGYLRKLHQK